MLGQCPQLLVPCGGVASRLSDRYPSQIPLTLQARQDGVGDLPPAVVDGQRVAAVGELGEFGRGLQMLVLLVCRLTEGLRTVWSLPPMVSGSGPRSSFLVSTFVCACGLKLALAAWNRWASWRRDRPFVEQLVGLVLADSVCRSPSGIAPWSATPRRRCCRDSSTPRRQPAAPRSAAGAFELCTFGRTQRSPPHALNPHAAIHDKRQEILQHLRTRVRGEADDVAAPAAVDEAPR